MQHRSGEAGIYRHSERLMISREDPSLRITYRAWPNWMPYLIIGYPTHVLDGQTRV